MLEKVIELEFGRFTFLDKHTVIAEAYAGVDIDARKVKKAIELIEKELPGDYVLILNRKEDYSVTPVQVYQYFNSLEKLKAIAIVSSRSRRPLPKGMESSVFRGQIGEFSTVLDARDWARQLFV